MGNMSNADVNFTEFENNVHIQQLLRLKAAQEKCFLRIKSEPTVFTSGLWCNRTWDGITCWGDTNASTTASQKCPSYIDGFNNLDYAFRRCTETGEWYRSSKTNKTWTDYSRCTIRHDWLHVHMSNVFGIANFGYALSLISLIAAIIIMFSCRRFYYKSNILHINLFVAFCFRALFSLLRQNLFTHGYAMSIDMERNGNEFIFKDGPHWQCRLLFTCFIYGVCVSQVWVFVEGFYLQMLIYRTLFTQQRSVKFYIVFGWCFPLTFIIPWVIARIYYDNSFCWSVNKKLKYVWITRGPITVTIFINFLFFMDNLRVLLQRTRAHGKSQTYRKFAKFTAMLVPLFGIPNVLFMMFPPHINTAVDIPYLYIAMLYSSFQGFILALLFCFLHEEIHANIKRAFNRYVMKRRNTLSLRSSISRRQSSMQTQNTLYQHSEVCDSVQQSTNKPFICRNSNVFNMAATNKRDNVAKEDSADFTSDGIALPNMSAV